MSYSNWCPSCTCGWGWHDSEQELPFQVKPPEEGCRQTDCDCHESWRWTVQTEQLQELEKRYLWGDR